MKCKHLFLILFSMATMIFSISCDNAELHRAINIAEEPVNVRTDDCEDCPVDDCCCEITYVSGASITLEICGSTGTRLGTRPCGPVDSPGSCPDIGSSFYLGTFVISSGSTSQIFCVPENASFLINAVAGGSTVVDISCQKGQVSPQTIPATLVATNRYIFETNGDCEVSECQ
jgi:hypothetical protein